MEEVAGRKGRHPVNNAGLQGPGPEQMGSSAAVLAAPDLRASLTVGLVFLVLYAATAAPTITYEDSGDFILGLGTLGIIHPPGYPIYTLIGYLFTRLPLPGDLAHRVALFSALWGALTIAVLYLALRLARISSLAATAAAAAVGTGFVFWSQSSVAEVYTLNAFLCALTALTALGFRSSGSARWLKALGASAGLGLANHYPLFVLTAPFLIFFFAGPSLLQAWRRPGFRKELGLALVLAVLCALIPYSYLLIQVHRADALTYNFARPHDLSGFWHHVLRDSYGHIDQSGGGWAARGAILKDWLKTVGFAFALWTPFLVWGVVQSFRSQWWARSGLALAVSGSSWILVLLLGFKGDDAFKAVFRVYPLPAYLFIGFFLAYGLDSLIRLLPAVRKPAWAAIFALLAAVGAAWNFPRASSHDNQSVRTWATALLESLAPRAVLVLCGDDFFPVYYMHKAENLRPDVTVIDRFGYSGDENIFAPESFYDLPVADRIARREAKLKILAAQSERPAYMSCTQPLDKLQIPWVRTDLLFAFGPQAASLGAQVNPKLLEPPFLDRLMKSHPVRDFWMDRMRLDTFSQVMGHALERAALPPNRATEILERYGLNNERRILLPLAAQLVGTKQYPTALEAYDRATAGPEGLEELETGHLAHYCQLLVMFQKPQRAQQTCERWARSKARGSANCEAEPLYYLGLAAWGNNQAAQAEKFFRSALHCRPDYPEATASLKKIVGRQPASTP